MTNFKNTPSKERRKMPLSGMLTCGNCGTRSQMNTMRYNLAGSKLICQSCIERERSGIKPGTTHSMSARLRHEQMAQKTAAPQQGSTPAEAATGEGMAGYVCRSCHFKFSRKRGIEVGACPYCGRDSVTPAYEGKAQDLIEESARMEDHIF